MIEEILNCELLNAALFKKASSLSIWKTLYSHINMLLLSLVQ